MTRTDLATPPPKGSQSEGSRQRPGQWSEGQEGDLEGRWGVRAAREALGFCPQGGGTPAALWAEEGPE